LLGAGQSDQVLALARELVNHPVAVIAAVGASELAAKAATTTIPIIFGTGNDPVGTGAVTSLNRPRGNITGATFDECAGNQAARFAARPRTRSGGDRPSSYLRGLFRGELRLLTGRKPRFDHAMRMSTKTRRSGHDRAKRSRPSNTHPLVTTFPAPQPWDAADPLPVMRREMKLLLIETSRLRDEVERLRAVEQDARYLSASVDQIMKSRDHWRREAKRVRALIAQVTPWSLLCWRWLGTFRAWWHTPQQGEICRQVTFRRGGLGITHHHDLTRMMNCDGFAPVERLRRRLRRRIFSSAANTEGPREGARNRLALP
jgi:ABC transporter substrate binding protein